MVLKRMKARAGPMGPAKKMHAGHPELLLKRAALRQDEVKRYNDSQALIAHRRQIDRNSKLATMSMERDQILGARAQSGLLPQHLELRPDHLQNGIPKKNGLI